jgi:peptidoglycan hydrolase-like protein with peptidoglycan-binding domain
MTLLTKGDHGDDVREVQLLLLMTALADPGQPDAIFGEKTAAAVERAQVTLGHPATRDADQELLDELRWLPKKHVAIPRVLTPATVERLVVAIAAAYEVTFARPHNPLACRVAVAQLQEEHGVPLRDIWLNNVGNQDVISSGGPYFFLEDEREGRRHTLPAFASLREGAAAYWARLERHYGAALPAFEAGAPGPAAELLKELGYYSGDVDAYRRAMCDRFAALTPNT